ncbi:efflux RND transporter permease subunit [Clostridiaceae bacterium HSG29]|nr:efflux RND transporter permease subunit [Clostridiaceae bacterium HSG29]
MKKIIEIAIVNKKITLVVLAILLLFGAYSYYIMPRQEFPEINAPVAIVTVKYPGASPEDIENLVTKKVEEKLEELDGYDYSYSFSQNNVSIAIVRLTIDVDIDKSWASLRQKMNDLQSKLPKQCEDIDVNTDVVKTAGIIISMSGENYSYEQLEEYADELEKKLSGIDGISNFDLIGKQEKEINIEIDYKKLNEFNLSINDIMNLIEINNVEIPSGSIKNDNSSIIVKTEGSYDSIEEIKNLVIAVSSENGSIAKLRDIAEIKYKTEDSNFKIKHNGANSVLLVGYFKENRNIVLIGDEVMKIIDDFHNSMPSDVEFSKISFQPKNIERGISSFSKNLLQGILFVILVVLIGMGVRNAIIVSFAIPATILITFIMMNGLSIKLHQISIASLIVALGMLVDNAIVINDSIQVKIDNGIDKLKACVDGTYEVAIPVFTSTLTTIAAFSPLLVLPSIAGEYIKSLPSIIMISLLISYLIAIFITPTISYIFLKENKVRVKKARIRKAFDNMLEYTMKHRKTMFFLIIVLIIFTVNIGMKLGLQFFPYADTNLVYIDIKNDESGNIDSTEDISKEVENILKKEDSVIQYTTAIGNGLPKFYNTMPLPSPSDSYSQIVVKIDKDKTMEEKSDDGFSEYIMKLQKKIDEKIVNGSVVINRIEQAEPIGHPVRIRILGDDLSEIKLVSENVKEKLNEIDGTKNVGDDFSEKYYKLMVDIDNDMANFLGVSKYDIQNEISLALFGRSNTVFRNDSNEYDIKIISNIETKEDLENLMIKSSITGNKILLKNIAKVKLISEYPEIAKYNSEKSILVYSDVNPGYSSVDIERKLKKQLEEIEIIGDIRFVFDGEREKILENFGNVTTSAIFAVILVFLILLFQFKSYIRTLVILFTIPLSTIGSILGLYIFKQNLSFLAMLGVVSLLGIVVNNAIVLVDYIDSERKNGRSIYDACLNAVDKRFRPIILTTATTIIGLTPLIYTRSVMFTPLAVALMSGLLVSTLLTLVVIPTVYYQTLKHECKESKFDDLKNRLNSFK